MKGKTREEVQCEIDAERKAKNVGAALGIPLAVIAYLIERVRADELGEARERFGIVRADSDSSEQGIEVWYADNPDDEYDNGEEDEYGGDTAVSYDDKEADDLDEDGENDFNYDDDGEEVYDEENDYDPDDDQNDDQDEDDSHGFQMKLW